MNAEKSSTTRPIFNALLLAVAWLIVEYVFVGALAVAWVLLFTGGFILWWFTRNRMSSAPHRIIVPYLLLVVAFIAHVYEEYKASLLGFPDVNQGFPFDVTFEREVTFAASLAPIFWLLGAVMILKRWRVGDFAGSTFLFGMMFIEPYHFIAPFLQSGTFHYVGGMLTAPMPIALGWYTFIVLRRDVRNPTNVRTLS
jgi:hypothetical protein